MGENLCDSPWPPLDGREFIRSEEFGELVVRLAHELQHRYPSVDFADAAAQVFTWFDTKTEDDPGFIDGVRFSTPGALCAYVRQAMWNAGRLAERKRKRHVYLDPLEIDRATEEQPVAELLAILHEYVDRLPQPHKDVFEAIYFHEEDFSMVASSRGWSAKQAKNVFESAIDMLDEAMAK